MLSRVFLGWLVLPIAVSAADPLDAIDFSRDIRPILAEKCLSCHSGEEPKGGLLLGERQTALGAGESGLVAIVPGNPNDSELIRRITSTDEAERMPPVGEKRLSAEEIERLRRWVSEGADWSTHWAFQPLVDHRPPAVANQNWPINDIDRFVLARLESTGFAPSPAADPYTLIKRLHYDLIGLLPPVEEVDAFAASYPDDPRAYDQLVDRLLQSPHFGERWGRHWLDLAHFADSDGYEKDRARPDAHLFRDWVIDAINSDMPFDQFTIEQLAGDLLPAATARQKIATGFLRQTLTNEEGGVDQEEFRVAACFDRTETVGTVWLALTVGCARCHTHKYDPLAHSEYYKLFAFFNGAQEIKSRLPIEADRLAELEQKLRPLEQALADRQSQLAEQELEWETAQHQKIMAQTNEPLSENSVEIVSVESAASAPLSFQIDGDQVFAAATATSPVPSEVPGASGSTGTVAEPPDPIIPEQDAYVVTVRVKSPRVTGLKLYVLPDERLPNQGPGLAADGNFVLTNCSAFVVQAPGRPSAGDLEPPEALGLELHRASADFSQTGFSADRTIGQQASPQEGWAIGGKTGSEHWIQYRLREPLTLRDDQLLRVVLAQRHGARHLIGKFRLAVLTGNERGLHLSDKAIADALEMYPEKRVASTKQQVFDFFVHEVLRDEKASSLQRQIADLYREHDARLMDVRTIGRPRLPRVTHVFHRGDFLLPTQPVDPGVPATLPVLRPRAEVADRLDLARWLVGPENFLTPRVAVNHAWLHLFGHGLVRTPGDFGTRGTPPTHPELLDWLSVRFQRDLRWSRKELIRLIVTSATYRQASRYRPDAESQDPLNTLLFRQNRFRVESEIVRDLTLDAAGLLSPKIGGPSVFPPMPEELAKLSYANSFTWRNSTGEDRYRRGMYTFFKRTIPHPNLMTFDSPDANVSCVARTVSNTPLQSLTLLNNESHLEAARALAKSIWQPTTVSGDPAPGDDGNRSAADAARLAHVMRRCVARPPTNREIDSLMRLLEASRSYYVQHVDEADRLTGEQRPQNVPAAEVAAWVATVRVVLNLDEFLTRE
jgi:hypothetical protein